MLISVLVFFWSVNIILRNRIKAGILATLILFLFFTFGHFINLIQVLTFKVFSAKQLIHFLWLYIILLIPFVWLIKRTRNTFKTANFILNGVLSILLLSTLIQITIYKIKEHKNGAILSVEKIQSEMVNKTQLPDIYYIILDGYTGFDALKKYYNFDNSEFEKDLTKRGFYVAKSSTSNYASTLHSLASSLNMKHLLNLNETNNNSFTTSLLVKMIQNSEVMRISKSIGYKTINYASGYSATSTLTKADVNFITDETHSDYANLIFSTTLLKIFFYKVPNFKIRVVPMTLKALKKNVKKHTPKFTLAHIMSPHPPFLFKPNGKISKVKTYSLKDWREIDKYIEEIKYINSEILIVIDNLIEHSQITPIIIIQGDHGAMESNRNREQIRSSILNTLYLPSNCQDKLYSSITPVNTFRVVFNCLLNTNYELLKDEVYWATLKEPDKFRRITSKVRPNVKK